MLKFEKDGKIVMTESDNGELKLTEDAPKEWKNPIMPGAGGPKNNEQPTGDEGNAGDPTTND